MSQTFPEIGMGWVRHHRGGDLWVPPGMKFVWEEEEKKTEGSFFPQIHHAKVSDFLHMLCSFFGKASSDFDNFTITKVRQNNLVFKNFLEVFPNWKTH